MSLIIALIVIAIVITAKQSRRNAALLDRKTCPFCHTVYGADARFCGRCGRAF